MPKDLTSLNVSDRKLIKIIVPPSRGIYVDGIKLNIRSMMVGAN
jgi:hypothetical protein